ncbi:Dabb family protein [Rhodococcus opacus]|uniref:Dabb family protein n=1 Tax=Rhodococcus opacus TaxID=37919 RepID=UPI00280B209A|nr:Dabb family protein [Rhodococcus opacus]
MVVGPDFGCRPQTVQYRHGRDLGIKDGNADYAVSATFDGIDEFRAYLTHPDHVRFAEEFVSAMAETYSSVQVEFSS